MSHFIMKSLSKMFMFIYFSIFFYVHVMHTKCPALMGLQDTRNTAPVVQYFISLQNYKIIQLGLQENILRFLPSLAIKSTFLPEAQ